MPVCIRLVGTGCARYSRLTSLPPEYQIHFLELHFLIKAHLLIRLNPSQIKSSPTFLILQGCISLVSFHLNLALVKVTTRNQTRLAHVCLSAPIVSLSPSTHIILHHHLY